MNSVLEIIANLRLTTQGWQQGINEAKKQVQGFTDELAKQRQAARDAGVALGGVATAALLLGADAVRQYADFSQQIAKVGSVAQATKGEMGELSDAALKVGANTTLSASQAADALYQLSSAGLNVKDSIAALDGTTNLAIATQSDLSDATLLVTSALQQFDLSASDASKVADIFVNSINESPADVEKLMTALRQVGPVAGSFGLTLEQTTAALSELFEAGFRGEQAGTSLRNILLGSRRRPPPMPSC